MTLIRIILITSVCLFQSLAFPTISIGETTSTADSTDKTHYNIRAHLLPKAGSLRVTVDMQFVPQEPTDSLRFLLHGDLKLQTLQSPQITSYDVNRNFNLYPNVLDTAYIQLVTVKLKDTIKAGTVVPLRWEYSGSYNNEHFQLGPSSFQSHWVELKIGSFWMPIVASLSHQFTFDMRVTLPPEYKVVSTGRIQRYGRTWMIHTTEPQPDVPLLASDQMQSVNIEVGEIKIEVYHTDAPDSLVSFVVKNVRNLMCFYQELFQTKETEKCFE